MAGRLELEENGWKIYIVKKTFTFNGVCGIHCAHFRFFDVGSRVRDRDMGFYVFEGLFLAC
jgi:hypothetical protein